MAFRAYLLLHVFRIVIVIVNSAIDIVPVGLGEKVASVFYTGTVFLLGTWLTNLQAPDSHFAGHLDHSAEHLNVIFGGRHVGLMGAREPVAVE